MHSKSKEAVLSMLGADAKAGLKSEEIALRRAKYGTNVIGKTKRKSLIMRVLEAFLDPMLLILCFALAITLGVNIGKLLKTGDGDFVECVGIFCAVVISVSITVCMEGRSERAFELLNEISDKTLVKVIRDGGIRLIAQSEVVVGDVILLESGNRIVSDGRLIDSHGLSVDESALTGESLSVNKNAQAVVKRSAPLAERVNFVFAGTVVSAGSGRMVVTAVGDSAEIGKIAGELQRKSRISAPLGEKLARLGRGVTAVGAVAAVTVFVVSLIRMLVSGTATFQSVQDLFIESVVLIVAAVPEGLPTIVALSLSVNVVRLARENVLIKKLVAAETVGCVSVICSDKTGTLTENKMTVEAIHSAPALARCVSRVIEENIAVNTTADFMIDGDKRVIVGSPTEAALVRFLTKGNADVLVKIRGDIAVVEREEFTSEKKYMSTKTRKNGTFITYYKGAPEKIIELCRLSKEDAERIRKRMRQYAQSSRRLIAFAHGDDSAVCFDGFAALSDPVRGDVKALVKRCKNAGIKVKMLTGDNAETAFAIARECGIATSRREVVNAHDTERLSDEAMLKLLKATSVIARSTPLVKLRAVRLLMQNGDVVAVTGDGINDAPAIKQADIGIAMGSGSEIAKEAGDIVLLDDSFSVIVKAIEFGRNVFVNFQRFIMFQLSVNFTAVLTVLCSLFIGLKSPFTALQLLWINIIMDGPPALTLGFEAPSPRLMTDPPKRRSDNLVSKKMLARIIIQSLYMTAVTVLQATFDFLGAGHGKVASSVFTLFVLMQMFNAFNCRVVGSDSIFPTFFKNRRMLVAFGAVMLLQVIITQLGNKLFGTAPLSLLVWLKMVAVSSTVLFVSELCKLVYRCLVAIKGGKRRRNRSC